MRPAAPSAAWEAQTAPKEIFVLGSDTIVSNATVQDLANYLR